MWQVSTDKYTIAWFKLADCISKGEREKAFGVYRLLAHSLEDQAYAYKLEGDLLFAFQDMAAAIEKYVQAAALYQQQHKFKEAAALYEDLVFISNQQDAYLAKVLELYTHHVHADFFVAKCVKLLEKLFASQYVFIAHSVLAALQEVDDKKVLVDMHQKFVLALLKSNYSDYNFIQEQLEKTVILLSEHGDDQSMQQFMALLQTCNYKLYHHAIEFLKR